MSEERLNELFSIVDESYSSIQEREIRDYITNLQQKVEQLETQQKEFINYLQEELNVQIQQESIGCETTNKRYILEGVLREYKAIIGDDK